MVCAAAGPVDADSRFPSPSYAYVTVLEPTDELVTRPATLHTNERNPAESSWPFASYVYDVAPTFVS